MKSLLAALILIATPVAANEAAIQTIAYEASGESYEGQVAVASVIKERMKRRGQTAEQVVYAKYQFSCWDAPGIPVQSRKLRQSEIDMARKAWNEAKPEGYDHYFAHKIIIPRWASVAKRSKVIGNHTFMEL